MDELVSTITRLDVMLDLLDPVEMCLVPGIEKGDVLINQQGKGNLQHKVCCAI